MSIAVGETMTTDLIVELRRVMAAHDGNRDLMFVAGRGFLISKQPEMKELAALKNAGQIEEADRRGKQLAATVRAWVDAARNQD